MFSFVVYLFLNEYITPFVYLKSNSKSIICISNCLSNYHCNQHWKQICSVSKWGEGCSLYVRFHIKLMRNKCQSFFTVSFDLSNFHILSTAQYLKQKTNIWVVKMFHISNKASHNHSKAIKLLYFRAFLLRWYCRNHLIYVTDKSDFVWGLGFLH